MFAKLTIVHRIYSILGFCFLSIAFLAAFQIFDLKDSLEKQRRQELKHLMDMAYGIVQDEYHSIERSGVTGEHAKARAMQRLSTLRYGNGDYFWINDMHPRMVMHPIKPELDGKDLSENKDPSGLRLFVAFVDTVKQAKAEFVAYSWPKPGSEAPQPKISYVTAFEPWGWIIGTGVYVDDLRDQVWAAARVLIGLALFFLVGAVAVAMIVARPLTRSIRSMTEAMRQLADGSVDVVVPTTRFDDELAEMGSALEVFRANAIERKRLAGEAEFAESEKKVLNTKLSTMLEDFKCAANKVLAITSERMVTLRTTSTSLAAMASSSSQQVGTALHVTEENSGSMQTVAAAAEQLSASIRVSLPRRSIA